ncbi:MAG: transpeptidase family protein [Deltaproteobacteria bacterium]|jgi:cell division protein FtsI (penicillin-binding protein 3)|nr:transpeptidase family protein [Deltaproteobacteria bacterium]
MRQLPQDKQDRLKWLLLVFVLVFFAQIVRAFEIQVVKRDILVEESRKTSERFYDLDSVRGEIYDRNGEKLASSVATNSVYVDGATVKERGEAVLALSKALNMDYETLAQKFEDLKSLPGTSATAPNRQPKERTFSWIKRHISDEEAEAMRQVKIRGVRLKKEYRREYPNGVLAAHLLGFVGKDGGGLEGLELALDKYLRVNPKGVVVRQDRLGRIIMDLPDQALSQPKGASVMLTLDRQIQRITEKALEKAVIDRNAVSGQALVVRVRTGEILASAVYPTFDPNRYQESAEADRRNKVLSDPFEPGSTFKVLVTAAALEEKLITPESVFFCENGLYKIEGGTNTIKDSGSYGDLTVSRIIQVSSNIGAIKIGETLGQYKLYNYLKRFAFGEKTGLAYPSGESAGRLRPPKEWYPADAASISFGQGLSVTSLQMTMAVASLANDGVLMRPTLVSRVIDDEGRIIEQMTPQIVRQVVSPLTARQVLAMMRMATMKKGTGRLADIPGYPVAGKTGTAQSVSPGKNTYSKDKYVASFVGVAPYQNPELCVFVALMEPWPAYYGGEVAAPVAKVILEQALPILDIPMIEETVEPAWPVEAKDNSAGRAPGVVTDKGAANFLMVKIKKGDRGQPGPIPSLGQDYKGYVTESLDFESLAPTEDLIAPPKEDGEPGIMPSLKGLSMREVMNLLSQFRLNVEYAGSGLAVEQWPLPGAKVAAGEIARISFGRP